VHFILEPITPNGYVLYKGLLFVPSCQDTAKSVAPKKRPIKKDRVKRARSSGGSYRSHQMDALELMTAKIPFRLTKGFNMIHEEYE
jgi:hypothetical protein